MKRFVSLIAFIIALISVHGCSTKVGENISNTSNLADAKIPDSEPVKSVKEFMANVKAKHGDVARTYILEPDKPYNPELLKPSNSTAPDSPKKPSGNPERRTGTALPVRVNWIEYFENENVEFRDIRDQRVDGDTAIVYADLGKAALPELAQKYVFYLKNHDGRWLIADLDMVEMPRLLRKDTQRSNSNIQSL